MKKIVKMIGWLIASVILILIIGIAVFVNISPEFGGSASKEQKVVYTKSDNFSEGKFVNKGNVNLDMSFSTLMKMIRQYMKSQPNTVPENAIPVSKLDSLSIAQNQIKTKMVWFGHSTFLLEIGKHNILIDPMFGDTPAPHPVLGAKRFSKELPIEIASLPQIDAVILSHDHYDHLDYGSIIKLKDKVNMFPEETVQAALDVKAKRMMPIHWGAFKLAMHSWTDPVERVIKKANELKVEIVVPQIGTTINMKDSLEGQVSWWK